MHACAQYPLSSCPVFPLLVFSHHGFVHFAVFARDEINALLKVFPVFFLGFGLARALITRALINNRFSYDRFGGHPASPPLRHGNSIV